jgi:hypothetical protein
MMAPGELKKLFVSYQLRRSERPGGRYLRNFSRLGRLFRALMATFPTPPIDRYGIHASLIPCDHPL